jgi:hypothetical protein
LHRRIFCSSIAVWSSVATRKASCFSIVVFDGVRSVVPFATSGAVSGKNEGRERKSDAIGAPPLLRGLEKRFLSYLELHQRRVVVVLRLQRRRLPEVRLVPVRPELDAPLGVGESLADL